MSTKSHVHFQEFISATKMFKSNMMVHAYESYHSEAFDKEDVIKYHYKDSSDCKINNW